MTGYKRYDILEKSGGNHMCNHCNKIRVYLTINALKQCLSNNIHFQFHSGEYFKADVTRHQLHEFINNNNLHIDDDQIVNSNNISVGCFKK